MVSYGPVSVHSPFRTSCRYNGSSSSITHHSAYAPSTPWRPRRRYHRTVAAHLMIARRAPHARRAAFQEPCRCAPAALPSPARVDGVYELRWYKGIGVHIRLPVTRYTGSWSWSRRGPFENSYTCRICHECVSPLTIQFHAVICCGGSITLIVFQTNFAIREENQTVLAHGVPARPADGTRYAAVEVEWRLALAAKQCYSRVKGVRELCPYNIIGMHGVEFCPSECSFVRI